VPSASPDNLVSLPIESGNDLLVVENLDVRYGAVQVLWNISLSVAEHKVTCIIGSNGAGKTSTLNAIAGVLRAKSGRILLGGKDITALPAYERVNCQISLVPEGRQLWPGMSVEDNLLMGCYPRTLRAHAHANLTRIYDLFPRLKERRRQMAGTLSGGEQQMCAIGRGLMSEPKLLMLVRALAWPRSHPSRRSLRTDPQHRQAGRHHSAGRPERELHFAGFLLWVRDGSGTHHPSRLQRDARQQSARP